MSVKTVFYGKKQEQDIRGSSFRTDEITLTSLTNWRTPDSNETDLWEIGYYFKEKSDGSGFVLMRSEKRQLNNQDALLEDGAESELTGQGGGSPFALF